MRDLRRTFVVGVAAASILSPAFAQSPQPRPSLEPGSSRQVPVGSLGGSRVQMTPYIQLPDRQNWTGHNAQYPAMEPRYRVSAPLPVDPNSIAVTNRGNAALRFSIWDGEAWKPLEIAAGGALTVACPACVGTVSVAFNNGAENTTKDVKAGARYTFFWSEQNKKWDLGEAETPSRGEPI